MTAFLISLFTASPEGDVAAWVPSTILATGCLALLTFVGKIMLGRLDKIEAAQERTNEVLAKFNDFAKKEELGNMGNRFDERFATLREDFGGLRERVSVIEARK